MITVRSKFSKNWAIAYYIYQFESIFFFAGWIYVTPIKQRSYAEDIL